MNKCRERNTAAFGYWSNPALGVNAYNYRRIVVAFDDETFEEMRAMAVKQGRSFAFVVRELVELGLETAKQ